jgi:hypothetical protein
MRTLCLTTIGFFLIYCYPLSTLDKFAYLEPFRSGFQEIRGISITVRYYKIIRPAIRAKPAKNRGFLPPFEAQAGLA